MDLYLSIRILDYTLRDKLIDYTLKAGRLPEEVVWQAIKEYLDFHDR